MNDQTPAPFFAVRHGTMRDCYLVGPVAFKTPKLEWAAKQLWRQLRHAIKNRRMRAPHRAVRFVLWQGLVANVTEAATWSMTRLPFLSRTFFTIGILNVQRRTYGAVVSPERLREVLKGLPEAAWVDLRRVHGHSMFSENGWHELNGKMVCHDYGDSYSHGLPLSEILGKYRQELCRLLGHPAVDPGFSFNAS